MRVLGGRELIRMETVVDYANTPMQYAAILKAVKMIDCR